MQARQDSTILSVSSFCCMSVINIVLTTNQYVAIVSFVTHKGAATDSGHYVVFVERRALTGKELEEDENWVIRRRQGQHVSYPARETCDARRWWRRFVDRDRGQPTEGLEKLTQEEARIASAESLKVTHNVADRVRNVEGKVEDVKDDVQDVGNKVQDVGHDVNDIYCEVRAVAEAGQRNFDIL